MHTRDLITLMALFTLALAACGDKNDRADMTPEQRAAADFSDLAWTLMEPLDVSTKCKEIGLALDAWDTENGARFKALAGQITTLKGASGRNFQKVQQRFDQVAMYCVHPKEAKGLEVPSMTHDDNVARVDGYLPKTTLKFELK